jgi:hypothetical protein
MNQKHKYFELGQVGYICSKMTYVTTFHVETWMYKGVMWQVS